MVEVEVVVVERDRAVVAQLLVTQHDVVVEIILDVELGLLEEHVGAAVGGAVLWIGHEYLSLAQRP